MSTELEGGDQESLGRALQAARAGEDRALAQQVRDVGEQAVRLLTGLWRLMRSHSPDNHAFDSPVRDFSLALGQLVDLLGPVHLVCVEGQVYVNDIRIRMEERVGGPADLEEELAKHQAGGLHFEEALAEPEVRELLRVLAGKPTQRQALQGLAGQLEEARLASVRVSGLYRLQLSSDVQVAPSDAGDAPDLLRRAAGHLDDALRQVRMGRLLNPLPLRRAVNDLVDASNAATPEMQAALLGTPVHRSAHARHGVRVCMLSVVMGAGLGLTRGPLADLGVGAMLHDVGYALLGEDQRDPTLTRHPSAGARALLKQRGFHAAKVKRLLVALTHHRGLFSGPTLYSRVVCIADDYDTLTRQRLMGVVTSPAVALERLQAEAGERYDGALLQLLVNRLGRYPPGTVLRLQDGRTVVSASVVRDPGSFEKPLCRLVHPAPGVPGAEGDTVDLALEGEVVEVVG